MCNSNMKATNKSNFWTATAVFIPFFIILPSIHLSNEYGVEGLAAFAPVAFGMLLAIILAYPN